MTTTILIVDDDATNRKLLRGILESAGYLVLEAQDGLEGLRTIQASPSPIRLVITDLLMPEMDGFQLTNEIRGDPRLRLVPILVYTSTYDAPGDEALAFQVGADRYILKTSSRAELLDAVDDLLSSPQYREPREFASFNSPQPLKAYNTALIRKLEDRNRQLEESNQELQARNQELHNLREHLEQRVQERTAELQKSREDLAQALAEIKAMVELLPICSYCRRVRNEKEYWMNVEAFMQSHLATRFSHGICPECKKRYVDPEIQTLQRQADGTLRKN